MERTIPRSDNNRIGLYVRTYYSLLRTSGDVAIQTLVESHLGMNSLLHPLARTDQIDTSALVYATLRLPGSIRYTENIVLGQRTATFMNHGYPVESWQPVSATARRRRAYFDGDKTLALYIASRSDIDDIVPTLTAYQIEWNKLHHRLHDSSVRALIEGMPAGHPLSLDEVNQIGEAASLDPTEAERLALVWGSTLLKTLKAVVSRPLRLNVRLLSGSLADYRKGYLQWWLNILDETPGLDYLDRRVYFVSSNTHSIVNLWSGHALRQDAALSAYIAASGDSDLRAEFQAIEEEEVPSSRENFLYYILKKYQQAHPESLQSLQEDEATQGIYRIESPREFDVAAQVIDLSRFNPDWLDPRLYGENIELLSLSRALIINIDYPLGMAAYELLSRINENVGHIAGIYIMGKAATLNARVGDIMIPNVIHDEHTDNTYILDNCFSAPDLAPYLVYGSVLDNQKAVTVPGTFLQNDEFMDVFYREGYTDIEMEAGPYLSAIYEMIRPNRHPINEIVTLYQTSLDMGIIHYASDTPLGKGPNLGAGNLSYRGMDPTYAASIAILRRIIQQEINYIRKQSMIESG